MGSVLLLLPQSGHPCDSLKHFPRLFSKSPSWIQSKVLEIWFLTMLQTSSFGKIAAFSYWVFMKVLTSIELAKRPFMSLTFCSCSK